MNSNPKKLPSTPVVHFPFRPKVLLVGQTVAAELLANINKIAHEYRIDSRFMSASFTLHADPHHPGDFYLLSQATYTRPLPKSKRGTNKPRTKK